MSMTHGTVVICIRRLFLNFFCISRTSYWLRAETPEARFIVHIIIFFWLLALIYIMCYDYHRFFFMKRTLIICDYWNHSSLDTAIVSQALFIENHGVILISRPLDNILQTGPSETTRCVLRWFGIFKCDLQRISFSRFSHGRSCSMKFSRYEIRAGFVVPTLAEHTCSSVRCSLELK